MNGLGVTLFFFSLDTNVSLVCTKTSIAFLVPVKCNISVTSEKQNLTLFIKYGRWISPSIKKYSRLIIVKTLAYSIIKRLEWNK